MTGKKSAGRLRAFVLLFAPAFLLIVIGLSKCNHRFKELDDFGAAVNYEITRADGSKMTSTDLKGNIVLITTIQSTCPKNCAISFWHFDQKIYQSIRTNKKKLGGVRIVSFVTDGNGNPVKDLKGVEDMLQDQVEGYDPNIWIVASGDAKSVFDFERNNQRLLRQGDEYYGGEAFQELMLLMDRQNHLRMVLSGKTEGMIRRMNEHMALLQKQYDKENK